MCVGIPQKVIEVNGRTAKVENDGHFHQLDTAALDEDVKVGDYLIAYQDAAINKISPEQAKEITELLNPKEV